MPMPFYPCHFSVPLSGPFCGCCDADSIRGLGLWQWYAKTLDDPNRKNAYKNSIISGFDSMSSSITEAKYIDKHSFPHTSYYRQNPALGAPANHQDSQPPPDETLPATAAELETDRVGALLLLDSIDGMI